MKFLHTLVRVICSTFFQRENLIIFSSILLQLILGFAACLVMAEMEMEDNGSHGGGEGYDDEGHEEADCDTAPSENDLVYAESAVVGAGAATAGAGKEFSFHLIIPTFHNFTFLAGAKFAKGGAAGAAAKGGAFGNEFLNYEID